MAGRRSRPRSSPARTPPQLVRQIVGLRWWRRLGPVQIGGQPGIPASTVHAVLARCRISRLPRTGRVTGEPARRYEHGHPGSLIHVDITKFASIPDGGGHRFLGRDQGKRKCPCHRPPRRRAWPGLTPQIGTACLHIVIDDHSRVACAEICADEKAQTAAAVLHRALAWLAARGITPERVLSDSCYRSSAWREACAELGITHKGSRPYRPQTTARPGDSTAPSPTAGAYTRRWDSETTSRQALPGRLHACNHHRSHSAIVGHPSISRLTKLPGHHMRLLLAALERNGVPAGAAWISEACWLLRRR